MFFSTWLDQVISRCHMDGNNCTAIVTKRLRRPLGLSLDLPNEHVYWWDAELELLERTDYDGHTRRTIRRNHGLGNGGIYVHPFQLFEHHVLYNNRWSRNADNLNDLLLFHRQRQPDVAHPCREQNNGGCSHLCIPLSRASIVTARCLCPAGWTLVGLQRCQRVPPSTAVMYARHGPALIEAVSLAAPGAAMPLQRQVIIPVLLDEDDVPRVQFDYNVADGVTYYFRTTE